MEQLEQERRFLIEVPLTWMGKFKVLTAEKVRIFQTYLIEPGEECSRVRCILKYPETRACEYTYTTKKYVSPGVNKENEISLTQPQYCDMLKKFDPARNRISKMRYYINFDNRKFELDIFDEELLGLAILEIELKSMAEEVLLPPYFKVVKEVTDDKSYSNMNLSTIPNYRKTLNSSPEKPKFARRID